LLVITYLLKGKTIAPPSDREASVQRIELFERNLIFYLGLVLFIAVPAFKTVTHLPPLMGILFGLGILWAVGELVRRDKEPEEKPLTLAQALKQIEAKPRPRRAVCPRIPNVKSAVAEPPFGGLYDLSATRLTLFDRQVAGLGRNHIGFLKVIISVS
jgi:hypothetical protein